MKRFFVTGTGTGVGKTHVAVLMARAGVAAGRKVFGFKPIETGCVKKNGSLQGDDQERLAIAAGNWQHGRLRGIYRFEAPLAPDMARGEVMIDVREIVGFVEETACDLAVIEGAGGWRVPLGKTEDMSTLARALGCPVVIVARASLGTINHTLLTIEAVQRDGVPIEVVVLSRRPEDDLELAHRNVAALRERTKVDVALVESVLPHDLARRFT